MEKILIITGGNKGLGSGLVKQYKKNGYRIFSFSRSKNSEEIYRDIDQIQVDLSSSLDIGILLSGIFMKLELDKIERIVLINNAGTLGDISRIENISEEDIQRTVHLNSVTPLLFMSNFIKLSKDLKCYKKIINISSGAAAHPYYGWSVYCSTKASIDMMTKVVALEQNLVENGAKIIAIYPGVINTDMQRRIRESRESDFKDVKKFIDYQKSGGLTDKDVVGKEIYLIDQDPTFETGSIVNLREYRLEHEIKL